MILQNEVVYRSLFLPMMLMFRRCACLIVLAACRTWGVGPVLGFTCFTFIRNVEASVGRVLFPGAIGWRMYVVRTAR